MKATASTPPPLVLDVTCSCGLHLGSSMLTTGDLRDEYAQRVIATFYAERINHEILYRMGIWGEQANEVDARWNPCGVATAAYAAEWERLKAEIEAEGADALAATHTIQPTTYPALRCPYGCGFVWRGWHPCDARDREIVSVDLSA